jgi:hypothetical protein
MNVLRLTNVDDDGIVATKSTTVLIDANRHDLRHLPLILDQNIGGCARDCRLGIQAGLEVDELGYDTVLMLAASLVVSWTSYLFSSALAQ